MCAEFSRLFLNLNHASIEALCRWLIDYRKFHLFLIADFFNTSFFYLTIVDKDADSIKTSEYSKQFGENFENYVNIHLAKIKDTYQGKIWVWSGIHPDSIGPTYTYIEFCPAKRLQELDLLYLFNSPDDFFANYQKKVMERIQDPTYASMLDIAKIY